MCWCVSMLCVGSRTCHSHMYCTSYAMQVSHHSSTYYGHLLSTRPGGTFSSSACLRSWCTQATMSSAQGWWATMGLGGSGSVLCLGMTFPCVQTIGEAKLTASQMGPGWVLWMSLHQAHVNAFDAEDLQVVNSQNPYKDTKFQMDLICTKLSYWRGSVCLSSSLHNYVHLFVLLFYFCL